MTALQKLYKDTDRYLMTLNQVSSYNIWKLLFIVDYWAVVFCRLQDLSNETGWICRPLLKILLWFIKPVVEGGTGTRIRLGSKIGPGFVLFNSFGVTVAKGAVIGENCTMYSGVFVAHKANNRGEGVPSIGNNVTLMSGCKVLGNVTIGDNVIIGANAVVISDVPSNAIVGGIPSKIIGALEEE